MTGPIQAKLTHQVLFNSNNLFCVTTKVVETFNLLMLMKHSRDSPNGFAALSLSLGCFLFPVFTWGLHHRFHCLAYLHWPVYWPTVLTPPSPCIFPSPPKPMPPSIPSTNSFMLTLPRSIGMHVVLFLLQSHFAVLSAVHLLSLCPSISYLYDEVISLSLCFWTHFMSDTFFPSKVIVWGYTVRRERGILGKERMNAIWQRPRLDSNSHIQDHCASGASLSLTIRAFVPFQAREWDLRYESMKSKRMQHMEVDSFS